MVGGIPRRRILCAHLRRLPRGGGERVTVTGTRRRRIPTSSFRRLPRGGGEPAMPREHRAAAKPSSLTFVQQRTLPGIGGLLSGSTLAGLIHRLRLHRRESRGHEIAQDPMSRLAARAVEVGDDPEHRKWARAVREEIERGIPADDLIGRDDLLRRRDTVRHS